MYNKCKITNLEALANNCLLNLMEVDAVLPAMFAATCLISATVFVSGTMANLLVDSLFSSWSVEPNLHLYLCKIVGIGMKLKSGTMHYETMYVCTRCICAVICSLEEL